MHHEALIRSIVFGALAGIIAALLAAWFGIRPESAEQIAAQSFLLTGPPVIRDRSWIEANPALTGLIVAVVVAVALYAVQMTRRPH